MDVYSFKDLSLALDHPVAGPFSAAGELGFGQLTVAMTTELSTLATAADGNVMITAAAGRSGHLLIEAQQTSDLHSYLLGWLNAVTTARDNGDVSNWATMTVSARNVTTGRTHVLTGVCPSKFPDYPYGSQGQNVTWTLMAGDVSNA